jgi:hypothetical protein
MCNESSLNVHCTFPAARIMIEDAMCLLLDVDDIDRLLNVKHPVDNPTVLKQRRQLLLEGTGLAYHYT